MLGIKGTTRLWYVSSITNMRFGKYRLFSEVEALGRNPYNGDGYLFMSKDRRTVQQGLLKFKKFLLNNCYHVSRGNHFRSNREVLQVACKALSSLAALISALISSKVISGLLCASRRISRMAFIAFSRMLSSGSAVNMILVI